MSDYTVKMGDNRGNITFKDMWAIIGDLFYTKPSGININLFRTWNFHIFSIFLIVEIYENIVNRYLRYVLCWGHRWDGWSLSCRVHGHSPAAQCACARRWSQLRTRWAAGWPFRWFHGPVLWPLWVHRTWRNQGKCYNIVLVFVKKKYIHEINLWKYLISL